MAGAAEKKKKEEQQKRRDERKEKEAAKRKSRRSNTEGGTLQERLKTRESKLKKGFTNTMTSSEGGTALRVPLHKPATLSKGNNVNSIREKQELFRQTWAKMAAPPPAARVENDPAQGVRREELRVFRTDKGEMTRTDQWSLQFSIGAAILTATRSGRSGAEIAHAGTRLMKHHLVVFTNNKSALFYKQEINKIEGYEAFRETEWPAANPIYCTLPGAAAAILPDLAAHFAAGTFGGIKEAQVRIPQKAWKPPGATSSYRVHLELDDEAFQWLKKKSWISYIGLYMVRWEHPPVRGIEGYLAPDTNVNELLTELENQGPSSSNQPPPPPPQVSQPQVSKPQVSQQQVANTPNRDRHVTGEETASSSQQWRPTTEEEDLLTEPPELKGFGGFKLTPEIEQELLNTCQVPTSPYKLDNTVIHREVSATSSPITDKPNKVRKRKKSSGNMTQDVSDAESEGLSSVE